MNWQQQLSKFITRFLCITKKAAKSHHGRFILLGLLVGLFYFPQWVGYLLPRALKGKTGWFLICCMLCMIGFELWNKQAVLNRMQASEEDRWLGHALIIAGVLVFPFCRFALWSQSLAWLCVLIGIAIASWGLVFFYKFPIATFFASLTVYPRVGLISRGLWDFFTPHLLLEKTMAQASSWAMRMIGFTAMPQGRFIFFPEGAVEVGWGCNGLDMAITIALAGLFMGLIYRQKRSEMIWLISCSIVVALIANVPRLMLVSIAYVYWGPQWFHFWHGFWGGQIFSGVLFTIYYYWVTARITKGKEKSLSGN